MTQDDFKLGLSTVKSFWPQWKDRLEHPGAEGLWYRFFIRLKPYELRDFEQACITWLETRNSVPTIDSLAELTETCYDNWRRNRSRDDGQVPVVTPVSEIQNPVEAATEEDMVWASFHAQLIRDGLHLQTSNAQRQAADLYSRLGRVLRHLAPDCERAAYRCLQLASELSRKEDLQRTARQLDTPPDGMSQGVGHAPRAGVTHFTTAATPIASLFGLSANVSILDFLRGRQDLHLPDPDDGDDV